MKFTIERRGLIRMVEQERARLSRGQKDEDLKLWACAARVFVSAGGSVAGHEALVFEDGECSVPGGHFSLVLKSFSRKKNLTIEADGNGLRIGNFSMSVRHYSPTTYPPAHFQVFPVTDLGVLGPQ